MKNNPLIIILVVALAIILCLLMWSFAGSKDADEADGKISDSSNVESIDNFSVPEESSKDDSNYTEIYESADTNSEDFSEIITEESEISFFESTDEESESKESEDTSAEEDLLLNAYKDIVESGVYKLTITEQRQIGGLSLPVITRVWFGDGYVSITEAETHNISTETFINSDGAYLLDVASGTADLLPSEAIQIPTADLSDLTFIESGFDIVSTTTYTYERYETKDGKTVDFLFAGTELKRQKLYSAPDEYELVGLEISADISDGRNSLPQGLEITDRR